MIDLFDRVIVLTLPRRKDRLAGFWRETEQHGWPFKWPEAHYGVDGKDVLPPDNFKAVSGAWAVSLGHREILDRALRDGAHSLLVLEDDVKLWPATGAPQTETFLQRSEQFFRDVPGDWEQLFLGGEHGQAAEPICPGVVRCVDTTRRHAYAVRGRGLAELHRFLSGRWWDSGKYHFDDAAARLDVRSYAPDPWLCGQRAEWSDIGRDYTERWWDKPPDATELKFHAKIENGRPVLEVSGQSAKWKFDGVCDGENGVFICNLPGIVNLKVVVPLHLVRG